MARESADSRRTNHCPVRRHASPARYEVRMSAELARPEVPPVGPLRQSNAQPLPTLTRRASLNAGAVLLDHTARAGVTLLVTPLLVSSLGRVLYGTWEMLGRLTGYMAAADGRPNQALRLVIAHDHGRRDDARKRGHVGAALAVW